MTQAIELLGDRGPYKITIDESQRQLLILALARLSLERPGWDTMCNETAGLMDNHKEGRAVMYDNFRIGAIQPQLARLLGKDYEPPA